jgi:hypothetical protein
VPEINKSHRRAFLTGLAILAYARSLQEKIENVAVVLDKIRAGKARRELFDDFLDLNVF